MLGEVVRGELLREIRYAHVVFGDRSTDRLRLGLPYTVDETGALDDVAAARAVDVTTAECVAGT